MKGSTKSYLKNVRSAFPVFQKNEKRFFDDFKVNISEYESVHLNCNTEDLICNFGTSKEVVVDYFNNMIFLLTLALLLLVNLPVYAAADSTPENVEYLENGDYIETTIIIEPTLTRASTRSGSKTVTYKNSAGTAMWSVTVSASFSYTSGKSSTCTAASGSAKTYSSNWKVSAPSTSRSGNKATSPATGSHYSGSSLVASYMRAVTFSCDTYGNLS